MRVPRNAQLLRRRVSNLGADPGLNPGVHAGAVPANAVALTQEEADAVGRLEGLGFSRNACLEAYIA